jgi:hypothetical protein
MEVVMRLRDLLDRDVVGALLGSPEMDPLTGKDALQEARLNEVTFDAVRGRAGVLFDLRGALQLRMAYTGLLVLGGVEKFSWSSEQRHTARTAWNVVASLPVNEDGAGLCHAAFLTGVFARYEALVSLRARHILRRGR